MLNIKSISIVIVLSSCIPSISMGNDLDMSFVQNQYREHIENKGVGVWEQSELVYFVVEQPCLKPKKYSGTKESKRATSKLLQLLSETLGKVDVQDSVEITPVLANAIIQKASFDKQNQLGHLSVSGMLVVDEDVSNCTRRRAMAFPAVKIKSLKQKIDIKQTTAYRENILNEAFSSDDYEFLSDYLLELGVFDNYIVNSLTAASGSISDFKVVTLSESNQVNNVVDRENYLAYLEKISIKMVNVKSCFMSCTTPLSLQSVTSMDIGEIFPVITPFKGFVQIGNTSEAQKEFALGYFKSASINFINGKNANQIVKDLSVSLLFNPNNAEAWNMLGAVLRALKQGAAALIAHREALMLEPLNGKTIIHLAKTYQLLGNNEFAFNYAKFVSNHSQWLTTDSWTKSQAFSMQQK